jgi:hypothetical protein
MKGRSLIFGAAVIVIANVFALAHCALNRMGPPDSVITLTESEFYFYRAPSDDDSGVTLHLDWAREAYNFTSKRWLNRRKLEQLGFKSSMTANRPDIDDFYRWRRSRIAFVAVEYNGPAWQKLHKDYEQIRAEQEAQHENTFPEQNPYASHLVSIDADLNASSLRKRHPDGTSVLIVPALISVYADDKSPGGFGAYIDQLDSSIHVPRPFSDQFRSLKQALAGSGSQSDGISAEHPTPTSAMPTYKVQLHFGAFHEPWVTGVAIP